MLELYNSIISIKGITSGMKSISHHSVFGVMVHTIFLSTLEINLEELKINRLDSLLCGCHVYPQKKKRKLFALPIYK